MEKLFSKTIAHRCYFRFENVAKTLRQAPLHHDKGQFFFEQRSENDISEDFDKPYATTPFSVF